VCLCAVCYNAHEAERIARAMNACDYAATNGGQAPGAPGYSSGGATGGCASAAPAVVTLASQSPYSQKAYRNRHRGIDLHRQAF
jgi:hypothetical protein